MKELKIIRWIPADGPLSLQDNEYFVDILNAKDGVVDVMIEVWKR